MSRLSIRIAIVLFTYILLVVACQTNSPLHLLVSALGLLLSIFLATLGQVHFTNDYCIPDTNPEPGPPSPRKGNTFFIGLRFGSVTFLVDPNLNRQASLYIRTSTRPGSEGVELT